LKSEKKRKIRILEHCLRADKPSECVNSHLVDSAFYPLWDGKMSIRFRAE